jgi:hypothetical protein
MPRAIFGTRAIGPSALQKAMACTSGIQTRQAQALS